MNGRDYKQMDNRKSTVFKLGSGREEELWRITFRKSDSMGQLVRVYYGWGTGRGWEATDDPRFRFSTSPYLFKIQLSTSIAETAKSDKSDACRRFLNDFLPAIEEYLVAS